jgi:glycosyltransferase involved in cell wall biosynthesis
MEAPQFSVIIPVYNAASTLARSIESVLSQKGTTYEIIVIDGDSTDGSKAIIEQYKSQLSYYESAKDKGVYDAMNKGIAKASGTWIYLLGADDVLAGVDILRLAADCSRLHPEYTLLFGDIANEFVEHPRVPIIHRSEFTPSIRWRNTLHSQSAFYHRSLFANFQFNLDYKILADYDFHLHLHDQDTPAYAMHYLVARCDGRGLSKRFPWSLYKEELTIKKNRLSLFFYLLNWISVPLKFLYKKW